MRINSNCRNFGHNGDAPLIRVFECAWHTNAGTIDCVVEFFSNGDWPRYNSLLFSNFFFQRRPIILIFFGVLLTDDLDMHNFSWSPCRDYAAFIDRCVYLCSGAAGVKR
jgi:hypothetical protein